VALDTTRKLLDRIQTKKVTFRIEKNKNFEELKLKGVKFISGSKDTVTAIYEKNLISFEFILGFLKENNVKILDISTEDSDLEDVFIQLTNN
jgi:ABC-2 type transport system ATP-binding protein